MDHPSFSTLLDAYQVRSSGLFQPSSLAEAYQLDHQNSAPSNFQHCHLPCLLRPDYPNSGAPLPVLALLTEKTVLSLPTRTRFPVSSIISSPDESLIGLFLLATQTTVLTGIFLYQIPR